MSNPNHPSTLEPPAGPDGGLRKLVRPRLTEQSTGKRAPRPRASTASLVANGHSSYSASHAELFYFQKQIQSQTTLIFVLDDGERIEGVIEWYDAHVIKVRHTTRTMIYKSSIKYIFKAGEAHGHGASALL